MNTAVEDEGNAEVFGIKIPALPEGLIPLEAFVLMKVYDVEQGKVTHQDLRSEGLDIYEANTMALSASDIIRAFIVRSAGPGCACGDH